MIDDKKSYNRQYYIEHRKENLEKKRRRYKTDLDYAAVTKKASREAYRIKLKKEGKELCSSLGDSLEDSSVIRTPEGETLFSAKHAAKEAGIDLSTLRRWCKTGVVPPPLQEEDGRRWRWFTFNQIIILSKFKSYRRRTAKQRMALRLHAQTKWNEGLYESTKTKKTKKRRNNSDRKR